jgi:hypothetical protein
MAEGMTPAGGAGEPDDQAIPGGYAVFETAGVFFPYTVTFDGAPIGVRMTRRGALGLIRRHRHRREAPNFWDAPIVHRERP